MGVVAGVVSRTTAAAHAIERRRSINGLKFMACRLDTEAKLLTNDELRGVLCEEAAADQREGRTSTSIVQARTKDGAAVRP